MIISVASLILIYISMLEVKHLTPIGVTRKRLIDMLTTTKKKINESQQSPFVKQLEKRSSLHV